MSSDPVEPQSAIESVTASDNPQDALASLLISHTREADPLLADLVLIAAVPRKFDASLLAMLSGHEPGDEEFSVAFDSLISMPFVVRSRDERYRMHDEIRDALIRRFRCTSKDRESFRVLNEKLADFYSTEHVRARMTADQFDTVDVLLRTVSPNRMVAMRSAVEDQLVRPLLEAQHHRIVVDPAGAGLDHFRRSFTLYEGEGRFGICRLLIRSWQKDTEHVAGAGLARLRDWGMYYRARLAVAERDEERARAITTELLGRDELDPGIRARCHTLVTDSLIAECRFEGALNEATAQLELRGEKDPDQSGRSVVLRQQAEIHRRLYDSEAQAACLHLALAAAGSAGNREGEAAILSDLSALHASQGNIVDASKHAIQAMHVVRTLNLIQDSQSAARAARRFAIQLMQTFGARDPRLADLFHAEARYLTRNGDIPGIVRLESPYVFALVGTGQFKRAHQVLDQLDDRLGDQWPLERSQVLICRANILDAEGQALAMIERNRRTVEEIRQQKDCYRLAAALTDAATAEMDMGNLLDDACSSAGQARELWHAMGNKRGVAVTNVVLAEVSRRKGDYAAARRTLGHERPPTGLELENLWYRVASQVAADLGSHDEAVGYAEFVVDNSLRRGDLREAAGAAAWLVQILMRTGRNDDAARAAERLSAVIGQLRELWKYRQTTMSEQADEHNGRAVRQMSVASNHPLEDVRDAVQHFDEALACDPLPCWYSLNQAYAFLRLGDEKSAGKSIDAAVDKARGTPFEEPIGHLPAEFAALRRK